MYLVCVLREKGERMREGDRQTAEGESERRQRDRGMGREGKKEGEKEGGRERKREAGREGKREAGREGGRERGGSEREAAGTEKEPSEPGLCSDGENE